MSRLLRFSGAVERAPAIDAWFDARRGELGARGRRWFTRMRACGTDVRELIHDGCPVACVADAPFAYVNVFTAHVNVGFFHGDALRDPLELLEGNGKFMRHVKLTPGVLVDEASLESLIAAAHLDIKARLQQG